MPRPAKPARLRLRQRAGRSDVYVIVDRGHEVSTGLGPERQREAEEALAQHVANKHRPAFGDGDPRRIAVADALGYYLENLAEDHRGPEAFHIPQLLEHFGDMVCDAVNVETCKAYVKARMSGAISGRKVMVSTARRELDTLSAALNRLYKDRKMDRPIPVAKPKLPDSEARWLTRDEAARLIRGALGYRPKGFDGYGRVTGWERVAEPQYHVARAIVIALYTATRHRAVLALRWQRNATSGSVDLAQEMIFRRGTKERETRKRRTPCVIPKRLLAHLRRWRRLTIEGPCEYHGRIIDRQVTGFEAARERAGLGKDVTFHTLKHTCITWLLRAGVSTWEVAGFSATSEALIRRVYGHHCPNFMENVKVAFSRR